MDKRFNLSTLVADAVMDQFPSHNWVHPSMEYNLFPNLPMVNMAVKPWAIQSNRFWIVTNHIPESVYKNLRHKNLVPISGYGYTYPIFEHMYYKQRVYQYGKTN